MDYRAIVERHIGKHTGLRHPAKACPHPTWRRRKPAARLVMMKPGPVKSRSI